MNPTSFVARVFSLALAGLLTSAASPACAAPSPEAGEAGERPETEVACDPLTAARSPELEVARAAWLEHIEASTCPEDCPIVEASIDPGAPRISSEGRRILLIDEALMTPAATRYRSRVLAFLDAHEDGTYFDHAPTLSLSPDALAILREVDAYPEPVDAEHLDLAGPFLRAFGATLPPYTGHGMDILPFLADRVPEAQFVVSEKLLDTPLGDPALCSLLDAEPDGPDWAAFEGRLDRMTSSLSEVIRQHRVNFVHLSWGLSPDNIARAFQSRCGRGAERAVVRRVLDRYFDLLDALASLEVEVEGAMRPVLLFQASVGAQRALVEGDLEERIDCAPMAHRLRIGPVAYLGEAVPREGSHDRSLLNASSLNGLACTDAYLVLGYETALPGRPLRAEHMRSSFLGLGVGDFPGWPPTSSFANPVALAHFVYVMERAPDAGVEAWIDTFTRAHSKPILDPLLHGEFPSYAPRTSEPAPGPAPAPAPRCVPGL